MSKTFSIPDCPRLSKYDGMGMAGAGMIYAEKQRQRREQEELRNSNQYNESDNSLLKEYTTGYIDGYKHCLSDINIALRHTDIDDTIKDNIKNEMNSSLDNAVDYMKSMLGVI